MSCYGSGVGSVIGCRSNGCMGGYSIVDGSRVRLNIVFGGLYVDVGEIF